MDTADGKFQESRRSFIDHVLVFASTTNMDILVQLRFSIISLADIQKLCYSMESLRNHNSGDALAGRKNLLLKGVL